MKNKIILFVVLVVVAGVVIILRGGNVSLPPSEKPASVTSFEDCVAEGNPVMESYPRQCVSLSGERFVEEIEESPVKEKTSPDLIIGEWISLEDPKFVRAFVSSDTVVDFYDGEQVGGIGNWIILDSSQVKDLPFGVEDGSDYLIISFNEETLFFKIAEVSNTKLDLVYLDRGGVLSFQRIPEQI